MPGAMMLRAVISNVHPLAITQGFTDEPNEFITGRDPDVVKVTNAFPHCAVMPLSKLTVNETGVNNGDITHFWAWFEVRKKNVWSVSCAVKRSEGVGEIPAALSTVDTCALTSLLCRVSRGMPGIDNICINISKLCPAEAVGQGWRYTPGRGPSDILRASHFACSTTQSTVCSRLVERSIQNSFVVTKHAHREYEHK